MFAIAVVLQVRKRLQTRMVFAVAMIIACAKTERLYTNTRLREIFLLFVCVRFMGDTNKFYTNTRLRDLFVFVLFAFIFMGDTVSWARMPLSWSSARAGGL